MELSEVGRPSIPGLGFQIACKRESKPSTSVYLSLLLDFRKQCDQWPATRLACRDGLSLSWNHCVCQGLCCSNETSTYCVLVSVQRGFRTFLMCIFLRISDDTPISKSFLTMSRSSLERCHFKSFAHVFSGSCCFLDVTLSLKDPCPWSPR